MYKYSYQYLYWYHKKKTIRTIRIIGIFLDWSLRGKMQAGSGKYPAEKAVEFSLPRWSMKKCKEYLHERVQLMIDHEDTKDDDLPECTVEEMWSKPDKWAVHAKNRKRALRVCDSEPDAAEWTSAYLARDNCKHKFADLWLEHRPAVRTRCEMDWCPVAPFCNQYQKHLKKLALLNTQSKKEEK